MKRVIFLFTIASIAILFTNCKNINTGQQGTNAQNTDSIKAEIEQILKAQDDALAQHNEDGNKKMQSTCMDSLLYVGNYERTLMSAHDYSFDMAYGWIERPHDITFSFFNNTVIVSAIYKSYYFNNDDTMYMHNIMTKVFVRDSNKWKMAYIGHTPTPVSYFKASDYSKGNPALYPAYVGVYQIDATRADTILLINGNLYVAGTVDTKRYKLFSLDDSAFMVEGYLGKMIFGKGKNGKVTHYALELYDGQHLHYPKVK